MQIDEIIRRLETTITYILIDYSDDLQEAVNEAVKILRKEMK